jgi:3-isopropylmalate dehydrogenase
MKKKIVIVPATVSEKKLQASGKKVLEQIAECFGHEFFSITQ